MEATIELAETGEEDVIAEHWRDLATGQREHGSHILPDANETAIREAIIRHIVGDTLLVARTEGDIVGFVMFTVERGTYEQDVMRGIIENLYVNVEQRGDGIGRALLEDAHASLAKRGADVVALEVMADNEEAREFYRRLGYAPHRIELERPMENDTHSKGDE